MSEKLWLIASYGLYKVIMFLLDLQSRWAFQTHYGDFKYNENYRKFRVKGLNNESGIILGPIIKFYMDIDTPLGSMLVAGERNSAKAAYKKVFKIDHVVTAGLSNNSDYCWDFEKDPQIDEKYDIVVSHAILEHLIDPYKHIHDLCSLLESSGYLIVHSVMPGYLYHRYPVDCLRFYPDWFEEVAKRLGVKINAKHIKNGHIFYMYQKKT